MADNNKTDTGNIPEMMDETLTRNTLKLKPIKEESLTTADAQKAGLDKVVDPLTQRNTETGPLDIMDDTKTRKTVKLKPIKREGLKLEDVESGSKTDSRPMINKIVDPLTQRNTETGPLDEMDDTRTRKTVKLSSLKIAKDPKPRIDTKTAEKEITQKKDEKSEPGMLKDTHTRRTLKLKAVNPEDKKPVMTLGGTSSVGGEGSGLKDTHTRRTLKLKAVSKPSIDVEAASPEPEKEKVSEDDTIKIQRPAKKPAAMPLPSLGATATAKSVNERDTVVLRPSEDAEDSGEEVPKSSKATIKLTPKPQVEEDKAGDKMDDTPTVNLVTPKKEKKKIAIGKAPPPKTPPAPPAQEPAKSGQEPPKSGAGGLKLKEMAPKAEAPRAQADQDKIQELKVGRKGGPAQASGVYTLVALFTVVLLAFSALVTALQYFNLWDLETIGGQKIEVPILDEMMK